MHSRLTSLFSAVAIIAVGPVHAQVVLPGGPPQPVSIAAQSETDPARIFEMAEAYAKGRGVQRDIPRAVRLYTKLVELGDTRAMDRLGRLYARGNGVPKDALLAESLFRAAVEGGKISALYALGRLFEDEGRGEDAIKAYEEALDAGIELAARRLAKGHAKGSFGTASDPTAGIRKLEQLAAAGDTDAAYALAEAYYRGQGVERDLARAITHYEQLAAEGNTAAMDRLGKLYANGDGVPRDLQRAEQLFRAATEGGREYAHYSLGRLYERTGQGEAALAAYRSALDAGVQAAKIRLATGHASGVFGAASDRSRGAKLLRALADQGDPNAEYALAEAYRYGHGVAKDELRAFQMMKALADQDYTRAHYRLAYYHDRGIGTEPDIAKAIPAYRMAVDSGADYALVGLGKALMKAGDGAAAYLALTEAAAKGIRGAEVELALGHYRGDLGKFSDRAAGALEVARLAEGGNVSAGRMVVREISRGGPLDVDIGRVADHLMAAATSGDPWATESLVRFYREGGRRLNGAAENRALLLDQYSDQMRPRVLVPERVHRAYDRRNPRDSRPVLAEIVQDADGEGYYYGMLQVLRTDRNAFTYILQRELQAGGYYTGTESGYFTQRTIRATLNFCRDTGIIEICQHGPLRTEAVKAMAKAFMELRG